MKFDDIFLCPGEVLMKFNDFCKIMKARYDTTAEMYRELEHVFNIDQEYAEKHMTPEQLSEAQNTVKELKSFLDDIWELVEPMTFKEASALESIDLKREAFFYIGPAQLFNSIENKTKVDTYEHKPSDREPNIGDVYHLWKVDPVELGFDASGENARSNDVFAVQCWCPSTGKEYWFTVDDTADFCIPGYYSAKLAASWPCKTTVPSSQIEAIYRQGEVYMIKVKDDNFKPVEPYHLGDVYFDKIRKQT